MTFFLFYQLMTIAYLNNFGLSLKKILSDLHFKQDIPNTYQHDLMLPLNIIDLHWHWRSISGRNVSISTLQSTEQTDMVIECQISNKLRKEGTMLSFFLILGLYIKYVIKFRRAIKTIIFFMAKSQISFLLMHFTNGH